MYVRINWNFTNDALMLSNFPYQSMPSKRCQWNTIWLDGGKYNNKDSHPNFPFTILLTEQLISTVTIPEDDR